jgi:pSer/pThr/pTyr-binding forkhead associated (FHA) protein
VGQVIKLVDLPTVLGRTTAANVHGLEDPLVSRQHLEVVLMADGNIGIQDRGSVNGTYLNGEPLEPHKVVSIRKGDEVRLGNTVLKAE